MRSRSYYVFTGFFSFQIIILKWIVMFVGRHCASISDQFQSSISSFALIPSILGFSLNYAVRFARKRQESLSFSDTRLAGMAS